MDYKLVLGVISMVLPLVGYAPYLRQTWRGSIKPHPFTFLIFAMTSTLGAAILVANRGGWTAAIHFAAGGVALLIVILSIWRSSKINLKISRFDIFCLIMAIGALILWLMLNQSTISITLLMLADLFGFIITARKIMANPFSESRFMWLAVASGQFLAIFAIAEINYVTLSQALFYTFWNGLIGFLICWFQFFGRSAGRGKVRAKLLKNNEK